jgi:hypothetical protein
MALVESFALHTRALSDFFYVPKRSKRQPDIAFAFDFFDPPSLWAPPEQGVWLSRIKRPARKPEDRTDRFGEQIGRLTFKRPALSDYASGWPVVQITNEIGAPLREFITRVDDAGVAPDFKRKALREIPAVARIDAERKAIALYGRHK